MAKRRRLPREARTDAEEVARMLAEPAPEEPSPPAKIFTFCPELLERCLSHAWSLKELLSFGQCNKAWWCLINGNGATMIFQDFRRKNLPFAIPNANPCITEVQYAFIICGDKIGRSAAIIKVAPLGQWRRNTLASRAFARRYNETVYRHVLEAEAPIDPEELGHTSTWKAFVADQTTLGICINTMHSELLVIITTSTQEAIDARSPDYLSRKQRILRERQQILRNYYDSSLNKEKTWPPFSFAQFAQLPLCQDYLSCKVIQIPFTDANMVKLVEEWGESQAHAILNRIGIGAIMDYGPNPRVVCKWFKGELGHGIQGESMPCFTFPNALLHSCPCADGVVTITGEPRLTNECLVLDYQASALMDALSGIPRGRGSSLVQCGGCLPALVALDTKDGFKVMLDHMRRHKPNDIKLGRLNDLQLWSVNIQLPLTRVAKLNAPFSTTSSLVEPALAAIRLERRYLCMHCLPANFMESTLGGSRLFNVNGLRQHLRAVHHYGVLRDEDLAESPFIPKYKIAKKNEARRLLKDILAF